MHADVPGTAPSRGRSFLTPIARRAESGSSPIESEGAAECRQNLQPISLDRGRDNDNTRNLLF